MMRGEQHNPAGPAEHLQRMLQDHYYRPGGPPPGGATGWGPLPHDIIRVRLLEDWFLCTDVDAAELELDASNTPQPTGRIVKLRDPLGMMAGSILFDEETMSMPAGTCLWVWATFDGSAPADGEGPYYEPVNFGQCCQEEEGSSAGGSSSGPTHCESRVPACPPDASPTNPYFLLCDGGCPRWVAGSIC